jgi:hypothetical protein
VRYLVIFLILVSNSFAINEITKVDMYVNCGTEVPEENEVTVHYMDCDEVLTKQLNTELRELNNPTKKEITAASVRFMKKHKEEYTEAFKNKAEARNIKSYPAIVFNDKYIVYGTNSYSKAISEYFRYKG